MTEDDVTESLRTPLLDEPISPEEDEEAHSEETNQESAEPVEDEGTANDNDGSNDPSASLWYKALHTPLLPDPELTIQGEYLVEGSLPIKLLKFIGLTFAMIAMVHWFVRTSKHFSTDRDRNLKFWQIWVFEGNFIVSDCIIFFVVGRLWRQRGIDHLAWIVSAILCNVYFESQHFFSWLRHSVTLYEMHCIWPWQLWVFASLLVPLIGGIVFLHAIKAYQDRILYIKFLELAFFGLFYLGPTISSPYFHFHHWFAGWMLGMHCNYNVWWSRAVMAWCWGMYINGIAVYGRDPVLTCEYAYFVASDNRCPFVDKNSSNLFTAAMELFLMGDNMPPPADWRNCSSHGYHP